ncbi:hypothetical protein ALC60_09704 [Trachymyrmex zeteki]|uniref:Uncharacterized protein n=1 Tax=Mycetomoellerius zeteki TaxID=64791 RepID=A0A151WTK8_9HYME|nr:hypothetical protein ALC60_09704 [Trachymyrmex zeteki]
MSTYTLLDLLCSSASELKHETVILQPSFTNKHLRQFYVSDSRPTPQFQAER